MSKARVLIVLCVLVCLAPGVIYGLGRQRFDGFHVYQVQTSNKAELSFLRSIDGLSEKYIFLNDIHNINSEIKVVVAPESITDFKRKLSEIGMNYKLLETNAQSQLEDDKVGISQRGSIAYNWTQYHPLNDTYDWLRSLVKRYPEQVSLIVAGKSYEGRDLLGIKISYGIGNKAIFLEGGIHAREWISPAITTFMANELLTSTQKDVRLIAESFDWYIVPHVNPDGYVYSHSTNRLWRKTRSPQKTGCVGVDPNRNWDIHWNEVNANNNPCSEAYPGKHAFSEIETRTLADYIYSLKDKIFLYVSFHSYGQKLLFPRGYTTKLPPNSADLKDVSDLAIKTIERRYKTKYVSGTINRMYSPVLGCNIDWIYDVANIKYSFCYELRPSEYNWHGFALSSAEIIPTGQETLDSLVELVKETAKRSFA